MEASPVVLEWLAQAQAFTSGREEGRAEGLTEARAEAQTEFWPIAHKMLLSLLQARFPVDPPADLVAAVRSQTDRGVYSQWFDLALHASSLEELRSAFGLS